MMFTLGLSEGTPATEERKASMAVSTFRKIVLFVCVSLVVPAYAVALLEIPFDLLNVARSSASAANRDFVCYWASARQLLNHQNPYDRQAIRSAEKAAGYAPPHQMMMRNPPTALSFVLPFGALPLQEAEFVWLILLIACAAMLAQTVRKIQPGCPARLSLLVFCFPALLAAFGAGQLSPWVALGVALFFRLRDAMPFAAGLSLTVCTIKPQLFVPFAVVITLWVILDRRWRTLLGFAAGVAASSFVCFAFYGGSLWPEYLKMLATDHMEAEILPVFTSVLRRSISPHALWLQFVPLALATIWAAGFFLQRKNRWTWELDGGLVLIVSALVAPYSWFIDEVVIIPAVFAAICSTNHRSRALAGFAVISFVEILERLLGQPLYSNFYVWTLPAWMCWWFLSKMPPLTDARGSATIRS